MNSRLSESKRAPSSIRIATGCESGSRKSVRSCCQYASGSPSFADRPRIGWPRKLVRARSPRLRRLRGMRSGR